MLDDQYYIYRHIRPDKNEVFYIGKGRNVKTSHSQRHLEIYGRNKWWKNIVNKNNGEFISEIMYCADTEDEINRKEIEFIALYGRMNLGIGTLCNLTDGGDGSTGIMVSDETRKKLSDKFSGEKHPNFGKKLSNETCKRKSKSMIASEKNLKGKKLPDWWREKISVTKIGDKNPMFGKKSHIAKKVVDTVTGIEYDSIMDAAKSTPYQFQYVSAMLNGTKRNKTTLKFT